MTYEPLNRRLALLAAIFAFLGVIIGAIALATNYWTAGPVIESIRNGTMVVDQRENGYRWNGLFQICRTGELCFAQFRPVTFIAGVVGVLFLLIGGIFSAFDVPKATDRRFVTPLLIFVASVLMTAALVDYASLELINSHSSRAMIATIVFAYIALPLSAFVAGRYSSLERNALVNSGIHLTTQKYSATNANSH